MSTVEQALRYARDARVQCGEPSLPDLQIIALAAEVERLREVTATDGARIFALQAEVERLRAVDTAARAYSESTRDSDPRNPNQTWRDLNDVLAHSPAAGA